MHSTAREIRIFEQDRLIAVHPVLEGRGQRRRQQSIDLRVAVDIGLGTLPSRQDADGWHLRSRMAKLKPYQGGKRTRFRPNDRLLAFLEAL